jgi:hypothetical protein
MKEYKSFKEFYPFYLSQHQNPLCRKLHFIGTSLVCVFIVIALITMNPYWLIAIPFLGYGFAWVGHYFYEKNTPATFQYPFYSLMGDFVLFKEMLLGSHKKQ